MTDPEVMAQLDTCAICERVIFCYEIYKSAKAAFSAAADKERGDAPSAARPRVCVVTCLKCCEPPRYCGVVVVRGRLGPV